MSHQQQLERQVESRVKAHLSNKFLSQFAIEAKFLARILDPEKGRFDQESLKNGADALGQTLSMVRRFEPMYAKEDGFDRLQNVINFISNNLPMNSTILLKRAANLAEHLCKKIAAEKGIL